MLFGLDWSNTKTQRPKMSNKKVSTASSLSPSQEEIVAHFNKLRQSQRATATKLNELQMDLNEHK